MAYNVLCLCDLRITPSNLSLFVCICGMGGGLADIQHLPSAKAARICKEKNVFVWKNGTQKLSFPEIHVQKKSKSYILNK